MRDNVVASFLQLSVVIFSRLILIFSLVGFSVSLYE